MKKYKIIILALFIVIMISIPAIATPMTTVSRSTKKMFYPPPYLGTARGYWGFKEGKCIAGYFRVLQNPDNQNVFTGKLSDIAAGESYFIHIEFEEKTNTISGYGIYEGVHEPITVEYNRLCDWIWGNFTWLGTERWFECHIF